MGKIILNNIEYGTGTPNSSNVDTTNLVKKDSIVTTLDDTVTNEQIPSAKAVHTAIQNLSSGVPVDVYSKTEVDTLLTGKADSTDIIDAYSKTEVDNLLANKADSSAIEEAKTELQNEIANIPKVTKTSELTNDSGFITANDIPEVDLEPYALKTQIPTTLPASDVYAWAKASTKPTYTASEVGALASDGTAVNASKVANNLTLQIAGTTKNTFNGSSAQTFNIPNASTSAPGVMTADMVTKLNGIATGATKNTVDTAMSSTSTNAVQNKVIYAYIQQQIQNQLKNAGDYVGKKMICVERTTATGLVSGYTYTNAKGGFADLTFQAEVTNSNSLELIVDGVTIIANGSPSKILKYIDARIFELKIPFKSTFTVRYNNSGGGTYVHGFIYVNE